MEGGKLLFEEDGVLVHKVKRKEECIHTKSSSSHSSMNRGVELTLTDIRAPHSSERLVRLPRQ